MKKEIKKMVVMSMAIVGVLYASAKEELLRYPDNTKAKLVSKRRVRKTGEYSYCFDLNNTPGTAEINVRFPRKIEENMDWPIGATKTVADVRFWVAQVYAVNTSTPMPEYTQVKGKKVLKPEKCEYIKGLYKTDPVEIVELVPGAYAKEYKNRSRGRGRTR